MSGSNKWWDKEIKPATKWLGLNLREIINYRDLIFLFVKRNFVVFYKQTILGPLWYIIQPVLYSLIFTFVFGTIANIPTDGIPPFIFYLAGTIIWGYFANCFSETSNTFVTNVDLFGKVYFPRITVPISITLTSLIQFSVQFLIFLSFLLYYKFIGSEIFPNIYMVFLPLIMLQLALLSIGLGLIFSSITARYRDLTLATSLIVQLWMFLTPVVYPLSAVPEKFKFLILLNPMTTPVEFFREAFLGASSISFFGIVISWLITICLFLLGIIIFNRVEKTFMDTV